MFHVVTNEFSMSVWNEVISQCFTAIQVEPRYANTKEPGVYLGAGEAPIGAIPASAEDLGCLQCNSI